MCCLFVVLVVGGLEFAGLGAGDPGDDVDPAGAKTGYWNSLHLHPPLAADGDWDSRVDRAGVDDHVFWVCGADEYEFSLGLHESGVSVGDQTPVKLDYLATETAPNKPPITHLWGKFFLGVVGGCAVSLLVWVPPYWSPQELTVPSALVIAVAKLYMGIRLTSSPRWRPSGIGILTSLPLGAMIMVFGGCLNMHVRF